MSGQLLSGSVFVKRATAALLVETKAPGPGMLIPLRSRRRKGEEGECANPIGQLHSSSDWLRLGPLLVSQLERACAEGSQS
jgi:hypothetical protein